MSEKIKLLEALAKIAEAFDLLEVEIQEGDPKPGIKRKKSTASRCRIHSFSFCRTAEITDTDVVHLEYGFVSKNLIMLKR